MQANTALGCGILIAYDIYELQGSIILLRDIYLFVSSLGFAVRDSESSVLVGE
uniref:Uncharacterized protein n=1 Tax=Arundo donax TaxID=35708 RepID=A0A0A9EKT6_ARUDO